MGFEIVTGYTGEAHVYSADVRALNRNIVGNGYYVFKEGGQFDYELISSNLFRIYEGDLMMQGVHGRIRSGGYSSVSIQNGSPGTFRNILVCAMYACNSDSSEIMGLTCLYGSEVTTNPVDPAYESEDLSSNGQRAYFPLYRLTQNAGNITKVEKIFKTQSTIDELATMVNQIFLLSHPVGSIFMTTNSGNPGNIYGGTWIMWGAGRVPVGVNANDSNFSTCEKTGGASTVQLGIANLPSHSHGLNSHTHGVGTMKVTVGNHKHTGLYHGGSEITYFSDIFEKGNYAGIRGVSSGTSVTTGNTQPTASISGKTAGASGSTANVGSGTAHSNLQPYITCYMWKRTA